MGLRVPATMDDELELELELLVHEVTANLDPVHTNLGKYGKSINISPFSPYFKTAYSHTAHHAFQKRCPRRYHLKTGVVAWTGETEVFKRSDAMALGNKHGR